MAEPIADRADGVIDQAFGQVDASPVVGMGSTGEMGQQILADRVDVAGPQSDGVKSLKRQRVVERSNAVLAAFSASADLPIPPA
jgi:hypothetical protein